MTKQLVKLGNVQVEWTTETPTEEGLYWVCLELTEDCGDGVKGDFSTPELCIVFNEHRHVSGKTLLRMATTADYDDGKQTVKVLRGNRKGYLLNKLNWWNRQDEKRIVWYSRVVRPCAPHCAGDKTE